MIILIFYVICTALASATVDATIDNKAIDLQATSSNENEQQRDSIKTIIDNVITALEKIKLETAELETRVPNLRDLTLIGGEGTTNRSLTLEEVSDEIEALKSEMENLKFTNDIQKLLINIEKNDRDKNDKLLMRWAFKVEFSGRGHDLSAMDHVRARFHPPSPPTSF